MPIGFPSGPGQPIAKRGAIRMSVDGVGRLEIRRTDATDGVSGIAGSGVMTHNGPNFNSQNQKFKQRWVLSGTTKDSSGSVLGNVYLQIRYSEGDVLQGETTSDASGAYSMAVCCNSSKFYIIAYKTGSPDVAGMTVKTLVGTLT